MCSVKTINQEWIIEDRGKHDFRIYQRSLNSLYCPSLNLLGQYRREDIKRLVDKLHEILHAEDGPVDAEKDGFRDFAQSYLQEQHGEWHKPGLSDPNCNSMEAYIPGLGTVRECVICGCLLAGGVTKCNRCAKEEDFLRK